MPVSPVRELIQAIDASVRWGTPLRPQTLMAIRRLLADLDDDGDAAGIHRPKDEDSRTPAARGR